MEESLLRRSWINLKNSRNRSWSDEKHCSGI